MRNTTTIKIIALGFCLISSLIISAQDNNTTIENPWNIEFSYNPMAGGTFADDVYDTDGSYYLIGANLGIQYLSSEKLLYICKIGANYKKYSGLMTYNESTREYHYSYNYIKATIGIEYLPFNFDNGFEPFFSLSIAPTHFGTSDENVIFFDPDNQWLLMSNAGFGFYCKLTEKIDFRFGINAGYNLLPGWKDFVINQANIGLRFPLN
jgi:hypothetical protein